MVLPTIWEPVVPSILVQFSLALSTRLSVGETSLMKA